MEYLVLGFFTGISLIFAIGPQNIFVIEQGLKKQYIFLVCTVCSLSDLLLIFLGIFLFHFFHQYFNIIFEVILNLLLIIFLINFIYSKIKFFKIDVNFDNQVKDNSKIEVFLKTIGFTYLNAHVYSDTVFFLGNFSKSFLLADKIIFGIGASLASILFFFSFGYASNYFSKYLNNEKVWRIINWAIISIMSVIALYVLQEIIKSISL